MPEKKLVFISYARSDGREHAERLDRELQAAGFITWRDKRDLDRDADFTRELADAIRKADVLAVVVTPAVEDSFVMKEIGYAQQPSVNKPIIPCLFANATMPILLVNVSIVPFYAGKFPQQTLSFESGFARLTARVRGEAEPESPGARGPFRDYVQGVYDFADVYLRRYVLEMMPAHHEPLSLDARTTPGAVEAAIRRQMGSSFFAMHGDDAPAAPVPERFERFAEAFAAFNGRVLLLGDPGAGKTTTLMAFARDAAARRLENAIEPLPIVARISSWDAQKKPPLHEWLSEQTAGALRANDIENLIASGGALLLLDGLDELGGIRDFSPDEALSPGPSPSGRGTKGEKFDPRRAFMRILPAAGPLVVSCRVVDYAQIGEKARLDGAVTLQPLGPAQIEAYLSGQPDLWAAIKDDEDLLSVAGTPLLLSYFAYAFRDLPADSKALRSLSQGEVRTRIFDVYVQRRYDYEKRTRPHNVPISREEMKRVLGAVAFANLTEWRQSDNVLIIDDFRRATGDDVHAEAIIAQARVLHLLAANDLRFVHLLLRDYFAFPGAVLALSDAAGYVRFSAVGALGRIGDARAVDPLSAALKDANEDVRSRAAEAMGQIGDARAVKPLIAALKDAEWRVRDSAAMALAKIGSPAVDPLIAALKDANEDVRSRAAEAMGLIGDARAVNPLIAALKDTEWRVRRSTADALGKIGEPAVAPLIAALTDADDRVRRSATDALGQLGDARAVNPLIAALTDADDEVRIRTAAALIQIGPPAVAPLMAALADADADVRRSAADALGKIRDARAVEPLMAALADADADVRRSAADALRQIGDARAVAPLINALKDADWYVRRSAADALKRIGTPEALEALEIYRLRRRR